MTTEEIDERLARWTEAWRSAQARCNAMSDEKARAHALRVADEIYAEGLRGCLRPIFKGARKKRKAK